MVVHESLFWFAGGVGLVGLSDVEGVVDTLRGDDVSVLRYIGGGGCPTVMSVLDTF